MYLSHLSRLSSSFLWRPFFFVECCFNFSWALKIKEYRICCELVQPTCSETTAWLTLFCSSLPGQSFSFFEIAHSASRWQAHAQDTPLAAKNPLLLRKLVAKEGLKRPLTKNKLQATLVRNYQPPTQSLTGVKCRATSVAKNASQSCSLASVSHLRFPGNLLGNPCSKRPPCVLHLHLFIFVFLLAPLGALSRRCHRDNR